MVSQRSINGWLKASRAASQLYICTPLIAGQALAWLAGFRVDWTVVLIVHAFGVFIQLFIVYANDLADADTDRLNRTFTPYSGGSRVLVDGDLTVQALRRGGVVAGCLALGLCAVTGLVLDRWLLLPLGLFSVGLLLSYSFPPIRLNYRGGGEFLQMIGTGTILPLFGWYAHAGTLRQFPVAYLAVLAPTMLACAVGTSLPDEPSDRASGKNSAAVLLGQRNAQLATVFLHAASLCVLLVVLRDQSRWLALLLLGIGLVPFAALLTQFGGLPGTARLCRFGFCSIAVTLLITLLSVRVPCSRSAPSGSAHDKSHGDGALLVDKGQTLYPLTPRRATIYFPTLSRLATVRPAAHPVANRGHRMKGSVLMKITLACLCLAFAARAARGADEKPAPAKDESALTDQEKQYLVDLARQTLCWYLKDGVTPKPDEKQLSARLKEKAACFVTLNKHGTGLRGCIGIFERVKPLYAINPLFPPSGPAQRLFQGTPAKSKFLATIWDLSLEIASLSVFSLYSTYDSQGGRQP